MATRKTLTNPRSGRTKPTMLRLPEYLRSYLDRKCDEYKCTLIELVIESIQNGEYYKEDLAKSVERLFIHKPEIRDKYYAKFMGGRPHHSYVTEEPLDIKTLAESDFIREAIDEKIAREAPDYIAESKEERKRNWHWLH